MVALGKLRRRYTVDQQLSAKASAAIASNLLVKFDTTADPEGGQVRPTAALADVSVGVLDGDAAVLNDMVAVVFAPGAIVPVVCADAAILPGVIVYNTAAGKISSTQGSGATRVGITVSGTNAANQLVSVLLAW
jgi:hypothetical protein